MTVWCRSLALVFCALSCVDLAPPPVVQRTKFNNSFRLARSTRTHVQQLLKKYKEQQLGNQHFEDRGRQLKDLPLLSTDFYSWIKLTDGERLHAALGDLQAYWSKLEWKRKLLEEEEGGEEEEEEESNMTVDMTLPQHIRNIQLNLRDLMSQVSTQMSYTRSSRMEPTSPSAPTPLKQESASKTLWDRRVEGYVILRDLDLYLTKLARNFLLLASKTQQA